MGAKKKTALLLIGAFIAAAAVTGVVASERVDPETVFETSDKCMACHNGLADENGEDASIGTKWRATVMAHTAVDPYWQAGVRRETLDHPKAKEVIEDVCSTCHMPMQRFIRHLNGDKGEVLIHNQGGKISHDTTLSTLAADGVSCAVCHQIQPGNFGKKESFGGGFQVDTTTPLESRKIFGQFRIGEGTANVMRSAVGFKPEHSEHIKESALCATCHTLYTHALDENGNQVAEIAEQVPYLEWLHSEYPESQSCQDCHMETVPSKAPISSVLGKPREGVLEHRFRGGNFLLMRILNSNRNELGLVALPEEIETNRRATEENLKSASAMLGIDPAGAAFEGDQLIFKVAVENLTGHKLPTAYPSRRAWLHVKVKDGGGKVVFESGALNDNGSIEGNDNDADPKAFEPHYSEITEPDQVQVYESIMGDLKGGVTTGLLSAASYLKDNRVLPAGFDKTTADKDVAVVGQALGDETFQAAGDAVTFRIPLGGATGPFTVTAELWYQTVGYRWAMNLDSYDGQEPKRFMRMYRKIPGRETAIRLAEIKEKIAVPPAQPEIEEPAQVAE